MARLALLGGKLVRENLLPYGHQWIAEEDIAAVVDVLRSDWITQGFKVDEFENKVAEYCGVKYAVAVSSGTAALHTACTVAGIVQGDEVITTPITFAATAHAVVYCGGKPVFADIKVDTLNIDPEEIIKKITPRTKVIIPVDFAGHPADYKAITAIARDKKLIVIADAAHSLGAEYLGKKIGGFADMTILSFHPVKLITTGEGGMLLTDNEELYEKLKIFRHHGIVKNEPEKGSWYYSVRELGYNLRITDFQCALGISQLRKLDSFVHRRREIATRYNEVFGKMEEIIIPTEKEDVRAAYHIYVIQLRLEKLRVDRKKIFEALIAENIGLNVHYIPLHLHPFYQDRFGYKQGDYPNAERYYERAITLPLFPKMNNEDVRDVIDAVEKVILYYRR